MDWLAKMFNLPDIFLNANHGPGGGMMQVTEIRKRFRWYYEEKLVYLPIFLG